MNPRRPSTVRPGSGRPSRGGPGSGRAGHRRRSRLAALCALTAPLLGCGLRSEPVSEDAVAVVDGEAITASDVRARFLRSPAEVRRRARLAGGRRYLLDLVVEETLLAREAARRGLGPRPSDVEPLRRRWVERLLEAEVGSRLARERIAEEAVRAEYERIKGSLGSPRRVRLEVGFASSEEEIRRAIAQAQAAVARSGPRAVSGPLREAGAPRPGARSPRAGGVFALDEIERFFSPEIAAVVASMEEGDVVHPEPVPLGDRYAAVATPEWYPEEPVTYGDVADQIRRRLEQERREEAIEAFAASLRERRGVVVDEGAFALVPWPAGASTEGHASRDQHSGSQVQPGVHAESKSQSHRQK